MMEAIFLSLVFLMPLMGHPLSLGFMVLTISSFSSIILCNLVASWFGYSLFLVYVGGILVMFSYVVALSPNLTKFNFNYMYLFMILFVINMVLSSQLNLNTYWDLSNLIFNKSLSNLFMVGGLYSYKNIMIMLFLLVMLLITMVMVVKICYYRSGPLRPFS
uniref:NADH dehydrogenase subunit 6 n=1 Tax=Loxosomella aloxiata TaxID=393182 RepID=B1B1X9_9BILA|nr:NADH dehydrogenase subunit 6 [Loxosomella aloxiata]BAG12594.1 NADH dehydrogenase subunit 6 [Loxosomella aloxiata]